MPSGVGDSHAAARVAWLVAGLTAVTAAAAIALAPTSAIPWAAVVMPVLLATPGALIVGGSSRHPVGWLLLAVGACFGLTAFAGQWTAAGHTTGAVWAAWWVDRGSAILVPATVLIVLLLPDGRLPSRRWRPVTYAVCAAQLLVVLAWWFTQDARGENPVGLLPATWSGVIGGLEWVLVLPFALAAVAVGHRLVRPRGTERRRLLTVLGGVLFFVVAVTVPALVVPGWADWSKVLGTAVLSGSVLVAVVRGHVDTVRVVVSYALVYACLTVVLLAAYMGVVVLARVNAPPAVAGLVTAAVALALLPVRGRLQRSLRRSLCGEGAEPHRALQRLTGAMDGADDLDGVLDGIAQTTQAAVRARWVEVELGGHRARVGSGTGDEVVRERELATGRGDPGVVRVGLAPGRPFGDAESTLLDDLARHGSRAARIVLLVEELGTARMRLVQGREDERSRLRRTLHDDLGPILAGLTMQLGTLPDLVREDADLAGERMSRLEGEARTALDRMRSISRDLRPPALDELGLGAALTEVGSRLGVEVVVVDEVDRALPPAVEVAAFRVATEAVLNAGRHAGVDRVEVTVRVVGDRLELDVRDGGSGLGGAAAGVGILAMHERAQELGGTLRIESPSRGGTHVQLSVPVTGGQRVGG